MKKTYFKHPSDLLDPDFKKRLDLFSQMTQYLQCNIPNYLMGHCWVGGVSNNTLSLITDEAIFQTHIYFEQRVYMDLLNKAFGETLRNMGIQLKQVKVKVMPDKISNNDIP